VRFVRGGGAAPAELPEAVRELGQAVWLLAAELDGSGPAPAVVRLTASRAAFRATASFEEHRQLALAEIVAQVRSTAIDLVRASEAADPAGRPAETPTEELLAAAPGLA
jgi:hypothetical protein